MGSSARTEKIELGIIILGESSKIVQGANVEIATTANVTSTNLGTIVDHVNHSMNVEANVNLTGRVDQIKRE